MKYKEDFERIPFWATLSSAIGTFACCVQCSAGPHQLSPGGVFSKSNLGLME